METITVSVDRIKYQQQDFCVLQVSTQAHGTISVAGSFPFGALQLREGLHLAVQAVVADHPKWGRQLQPGPVLLPLAAEPRVVLGGAEIGAQVPYLEVLLRGQGDAAVTAAAVVKGDAEAVIASSGVDPKTADAAVRGWKEFVAAARLTSAMRRAGCTPGEVWGAACTKVPPADILADPWVLFDKKVTDLGRADDVAGILGVKQTPEVRARILAREVLDRGADRGDTCVRATEMVAELVRGVEGWDAKRSVEFLRHCNQHARNVLCLSRSPAANEVLCYSPSLFKWEDDSSGLLADRLASARVDPGSPYGEALRRLGKSDDLAEAADAVAQASSHLSPAQRGALAMGLLHGVFVLTGLPGTGKTTTLRALVAALGELGANVMAVAPTGVAARRIRQLCGVPAQTFHAGFRFQPGRNLERGGDYVGLEGGAKGRASDAFADDWGYGPGCPVDADVVVVDESSMMDLALFYRLLAATRPGCRIILVGDPAQIPSVGPGSVLGDVLKVPQVPRVHLSGIFRQTMASPVVLAAHAIYEGSVPEMRDASTPEEALDPSRQDDVCLLTATTEEEALYLGCEVVDTLYRGASRVGAAQLLSPRHGGAAGVTRFNEVLRERLNPASPTASEVKVASGVIRQGDRVMVVKNDADLGVYNGDIGEVTDVFTSSGRGSGKSVVVRVDGSPPHVVTLARDHISGYLRLAHAITYHKSQANEYEWVVIVLIPGFGNQVTRRLLYTAVTRAKRRVIIVGTRGAVASAVARTGDDDRLTFLTERIVRKIAGSDPQATG